MSGRGWFKLHRGWMGSPDFQAEPFTEREAFLWSIEQAAFEPHVQWFNGHEIAVGVGAFATSIRKMATAFQWREKRVRLFVARMERRGKWAQQKAQEGAHLATILTVCNYAFYQGREGDEGTAGGTVKGTPGAQQGHSGGTQHKKEEERKEGKEQVVKASPSPAHPFADAVAIWTEFAGRHGWTPLNPTLTDKRKRGLGRILSAHGLDGWRAALERAASGETLGGHDPPGWFNFTFLCSLDNFTKTYEGNYDRAFNRSNDTRKAAWQSANERVASASFAQPRNEPSNLLQLGSPERIAGA